MSALAALQSATSTSQNLSTGVTGIQGYAPAAGRLVFASITITSLNGSAAVLTVRVRDTTNGADVDAMSIAKSASTQTRLGPITLGFFIAAGSVTYAVDVSSTNSSDTTASVKVEWFDAIHADTVAVSGTSQTARDLGASVLLSPGTGTGQISLAGGAVTVGTNNDKTGYTASTVSDKTGYSLTQAFPANFSSLVITAGGAMTAGTVNDKTGYSLSGTQTFNLTGNITGSLSGSVGSVAGNVSGNVIGSVGSISGIAFPAGFSSLTVAAIQSGLFATDANVNAAAIRFLGMIELDGSVYRYTTNSLEQAPSGVPSFAGPIGVTILFKDGSAVAVPGVTFTVVGVGSGVANGAGSFAGGLPATGTYNVRAAPTSGVLFADTPIVVTASGQTFTITGVAASIPVPSDPSQVAGYLDCFDGTGALQGGVKLDFRIVASDAATGISLPRRTWSKKSDSDGRLRADFRPSTAYQGRRDEGDWVDFTTPGSGSFALPGILGFMGP